MRRGPCCPVRTPPSPAPPSRRGSTPPTPRPDAPPRPGMSDAADAACMTTQVAVRLPDGLISRLDALVPTTHQSRSEAVRRAIELYLYRLACEFDARQYDGRPLTDAELSLADDRDGWSDTPLW